MHSFLNYQVELEKLKVHLGRQLSMHYESKTKGTEKIVAENDRLRKELKKVWLSLLTILIFMLINTFVEKWMKELMSVYSE